MSYQELYEKSPMVYYDDDGPLFIRVCPNCGRFVKADETVRTVADLVINEPNATCKKCGRVEMPLVGYMPF